MANRKTPIIQGEFYHIYNRGNNRQKIFFDNEDYIRFVKLLYLCNSKKRVNFREDIVEKKIDAWDFDKGESIIAIGAWVLMPNHFHIYLTHPKGYLWEKDINPISVFMEKLGTAYSKYLNKKYNRSGGVFEGTYKSTHISDEIQAKYLFSYIHLNPVKIINSKWKEEGIENTKEVLSFLDEYKWSSFIDHKGIVRPENKIINMKDFLNYFASKESFENDIFEFIKNNPTPKVTFGKK